MNQVLAKTKFAIIAIVALSTSVSFASDGPKAPQDSGRVIRHPPATTQVVCRSQLAQVAVPPQVREDIRSLIAAYRNTQRVYSGLDESIPEITDAYYWKQMHIIEVQYGVIVNWNTGGCAIAEYPDDLPIPVSLSRKNVSAIWEALERWRYFAQLFSDGSKNAKPAMDTWEDMLQAYERLLTITVDRETGAILGK